jgi:hypothetical protein
MGYEVILGDMGYCKQCFKAYYYVEMASYELKQEQNRRIIKNVFMIS